MRIAIFTDSFFPYISGVSSAVYNQAKALAKRGNKIEIISAKPHKNLKLKPEKNIKFVYSPISFKYTKLNDLYIALPTILPLLKEIKKFNPDIIHIHTQFTIGIEGIIIAHLLGKPIIGTFHTFFSEKEYLKSFNLPPNAFTQKFMWLYSLGFYNRCKTVICPSKIVNKELVKHNLKTKSIVVSNGIEVPNPNSEEYIKKLRIKYGVKDTFNFIYVGRISKEKSIEQVIKAFYEISKENNNYKLILIGDGPDKKNLENMVAKLGLNEKVLFTGMIKREKLLQDRLFLLGDVFITASKTENQPVSILEAISFGLPVIGPNAKGIPEIVKNNVNGLIFKTNNQKDLIKCMNNIIKNKKLRVNLATGSIKIAKENSIERTAEKLETIYKKAIAS